MRSIPSRAVCRIARRFSARLFPIVESPNADHLATIARLEASAHKLRSEFDSGVVKRPLIIEFSGLPKAGKTRTISILELFLKRNGFNVDVFIERASIAPIRTKGHLHFNTWVSCASLQGMLEALSKPELDVFILDRGLFDALVWTHWLCQTGKITPDEEEACYKFFAMSRWTDLVDLVLIMTCDPGTSIAREYSNQLTTKRGTIMSEGTLRQINRSIHATRDAHGARFKAIEHIDTTGAESRDTAVKVTEKTLDVLTNFVDEQICVVPADVVSTEIPSKGLVEDSATVEAFVNAVNSHKRFVRRSQAEGDPNLIQPIPCAIIRWNEQILLLRRNKRGHALHEKYLLWAGGHANIGDDSTSILVVALERELSEEVFIKGAYRLSDKPIALVRTDENARASRHIGVLYEITLSSDDVALAMNQKEFKETRGSSMSGKLVAPETLPEIYDKLNDWSKSMVHHFWPDLKVGSGTPLLSGL
jgi:predicted NUDIX family phosphoesterase